MSRWGAIGVLLLAEAAQASTEGGTVRLEHASNWWVIHNDWSAAEMPVAALLVAISTRRKVAVRGTGDCAVYDNTETAMSVTLVD